MRVTALSPSVPPDRGIEPTPFHLDFEVPPPSGRAQSHPSVRSPLPQTRLPLRPPTRPLRSCGTPVPRMLALPRSRAPGRPPTTQNDGGQSCWPPGWHAGLSTGEGGTSRPRLRPVQEGPRPREGAERKGAAFRAGESERPHRSPRDGRGSAGASSSRGAGQPTPVLAEGSGGQGTWCFTP